MNKEAITFGICIFIWFGILALCLHYATEKEADKYATGIFMFCTLLTFAIGLLIAGLWW